VLLSLLAIRSLENFIENMQRPLPGMPTIGVSILAPTSKFVCVFWAPSGGHGERKIYTGLGRMSLHRVIGGLCYRHIC
jgi:hypothetical protein